jgi:hypothetical protein
MLGTKASAGAAPVRTSIYVPGMKFVYPDG